MNWDVKLGWGQGVACVTSLAAADAVERLYRMAWDRGERPRTSVDTVAVEHWWHYIPPERPSAPAIRREAPKCPWCGSDGHNFNTCMSFSRPYTEVQER